MQSEVYRFRFKRRVPLGEAEATLHLAFLAVESLFGTACVRMDGAYLIDEQLRVCVVDASGAIGQAICRIFTGFLIREFGEAAFEVRRVGAPSRERSGRAPDNGCACGAAATSRRPGTHSL